MKPFDAKSAFLYKLPLVFPIGPIVGAVRMKPILHYRCNQCQAVVKILGNDAIVASAVSAFCYGGLLVFAGAAFEDIRKFDWWPLGLPVVIVLFLWTAYSFVVGIKNQFRFRKAKTA